MKACREAGGQQSSMYKEFSRLREELWRERPEQEVGNRVVGGERQPWGPLPR